MHLGIREMPIIKGKEIKFSFELRTLIVTLRASRSANEETPPTTAGMQETEGALPPVASVALFSLPAGSLLLCLGCSIVDGGVTITSGARVAVFAAGVGAGAGVGARAKVGA